VKNFHREGLRFAAQRLLNRHMKFLLLTLAAACAFCLSCERHEFEGTNGTKQLHEAHGAHQADHPPGEAPNAGHAKDNSDAQ
jgi:hypothetical protein